MTALTTWDGVANGADIAVMQGDNRSRWTWDGHGLVDDKGDRLDLWFFSGLMAEGKVHLADFSPPIVGEWFTSTRSARCWLVLAEESDNETWVATFDHGTFIGLHQVGRIVEAGTREQPEWVTPTVQAMLRAMGHQLLNQQNQIEMAERIRRENRHLSSELHTVKSYIESMSGRLERMRAM